MSNTGYSCFINGIETDLINIFNTNGTSGTTETGYVTPDNKDLNKVFAEYTSGEYGPNTGYKFILNNEYVDLNQYFQYVKETVPSAPTNLSLTAGEFNILAKWDRPSTDGGSPITYYNLYYSTNNTNYNIINIGDVLTYDLTGLNYNTTYYIYVTAVNSIGEGNASSVASITTLNLPVFSPTSGTITNTYFTPLVLNQNFIMPTNYNYFNFYIYGGGGNSYQVSTSSGTGGGGGGGYIQALNIPYSSNGATINKITYLVGSGGQNEDYSQIVVYYNNFNSITLNANSGDWVNSNGQNGAAGGTTTYSNTTSFYNNSNITAYTGPSGGNAGNGGNTSQRTASGAGGNSSGPSYTTATKNYTINAADGNTYTNSSKGGGSNQTVSGYGSGGAATPANYMQNASAYRNGTQGVIYYALS